MSKPCMDCETGTQEYTYGGEWGLCASCASGKGYVCRDCGVKKVDELGLQRKAGICWTCENFHRQNSKVYRLKWWLKIQIKSLPLILTPVYRKFYFLFNDPRFETASIGCDVLGYPQRYLNCLCSPRNSLAFAETGGDYVHFSILFVHGRSYDQNPIMVTYPMDSEDLREGYLILAENLQQFMSMGWKYGFEVYEDLVVGVDDVITQIEQDEVKTDFGKDELALLAEIKEQFGEFNFAGIREHIDLVNKKYKGYLNR